MAFTLPFAWASAAGGAALTENAFATVGLFVAGGLAGGAAGRRAGTQADATGKDGIIDVMTVMTVLGSALIVGAAVLPIGN